MEVSKNRPDGVLLVIAYFAVLGIGFLLGGVMMLVTVVPGALAMARDDSFFLGGVGMVVVMTVAFLLFGGFILLVTRGLWQGRPGSRAKGVVLAALLSAMCVLSLPSFFFAFDSHPTQLWSMIGIAVAIGGASVLSLWYLMRPDVRATLG